MTAQAIDVYGFVSVFSTKPCKAKTAISVSCLTVVQAPYLCTMLVLGLLVGECSDNYTLFTEKYCFYPVRLFELNSRPSLVKLIISMMSKFSLYVNCYSS